MIRHEDRNLCASDEVALYQDSVGRRLEQLASEDLRSRLRRAKLLMEKYRDVYRRQRNGSRGKAMTGRRKDAGDFERSGRKVELFQEVLRRFKYRLRVLEDLDRSRLEERRHMASAERRRVDRDRRRSDSERIERKSHLARPKADAGPSSHPGALPPKSGQTIQNVFAKNVAGHFRSANRSFQARRDGRR